MKTGTAVALAIGVPVTIGVIAWAVLANKVIDKLPDDFGTGELPLPPNTPIPDPTPPVVEPPADIGVPPPVKSFDTIFDTYRGIDWHIDANGDGTWWWKARNPESLMEANSDRREGRGISYAQARRELLAFIDSELGPL